MLKFLPTIIIYFSFQVTTQPSSKPKKVFFKIEGTE